MLSKSKCHGWFTVDKSRAHKIAWPSTLNSHPTHELTNTQSYWQLNIKRDNGSCENSSSSYGIERKFYYFAIKKTIKLDHWHCWHEVLRWSAEDIDLILFLFWSYVIRVNYNWKALLLVTTYYFSNRQFTFQSVYAALTCSCRSVLNTANAILGWRPYTIPRVMRNGLNAWIILPKQIH